MISLSLSLPRSGGSFNPASLGSMAAWFKFNSGITVTGAGVSQWDDQSGNARHLKQATDTNRPAQQADGSILFDGVDNYLKCDAFTLNQPETVYLLGKQVAFTASDYIFDGNGADSGSLMQSTVNPSPDLRLYAGAAVEVTGPAIGAYAVIAAVFNGASSLVQLHNDTADTGNAGAANMGGFTLGCAGTAVQFASIQVKEVLIYSAAHDAAQRTKVFNYLRSVGGI